MTSCKLTPISVIIAFAILLIAFSFAHMYRYDIFPTYDSNCAYRLDRWTGKVTFIAVSKELKIMMISDNEEEEISNPHRSNTTSPTIPGLYDGLEEGQ